jgi:DNA (cytosine-5)-methyltransferase 1
MSTIDSLPALDSAAHGGCPSAPCSVSFLSVCSGIEAASVAWEPLGWKACGFAEIEKFPSAVLAHHWPETPNMGDMTKHHEWPNTLRPDLIVGGTPCQAFSVAGLRQGLADPRGNLTLVFLGLLEQLRPRWVVWENVPGVLSDKTGAFGAFLGGLGELGYGFAYRILDAQHFGVPQRRRRVFVVGYLGDWRRAAAVLFEPESMRGDHPPRREAGQISPPVRMAQAAARRWFRWQSKPGR